MIFRSESLGGIGRMLYAMAGGYGLGQGSLTYVMILERAGVGGVFVIAFAAAILLSAGLGRTLGRWVREAAPKPRAAAEAVGCVLSLAVLVLSVASIASGSYNPFIYFQF